MIPTNYKERITVTDFCGCYFGYVVKTNIIVTDGKTSGVLVAIKKEDIEQHNPQRLGYFIDSRTVFGQHTSYLRRCTEKDFPDSEYVFRAYEDHSITSRIRTIRELTTILEDEVQ